jgi:hypothetical protein
MPFSNIAERTKICGISLLTPPRKRKRQVTTLFRKIERRGLGEKHY